VVLSLLLNAIGDLVDTLEGTIVLGNGLNVAQSF
jgi:hypothetical protein